MHWDIPHTETAVPCPTGPGYISSVNLGLFDRRDIDIWFAISFRYLFQKNYT